MPLTVTDPWKAAGAVAAVVLLNAVLSMTLYVRGDQRLRRRGGGDAVRRDPRRRGVLSWVMLGQRPDIGIAVGLVVGAAACWLANLAAQRRSQRQDSVTRTDGPIMRASSPTISGPAG